MFLVTIHFGFLAKIVDIKIAYLSGELEGYIYVESLQGMSGIGKDGSMVLNSAFMAVHATWPYCKEALEFLKKLQC